MSTSASYSLWEELISDLANLEGSLTKVVPQTQGELDDWPEELRDRGELLIEISNRLNAIARAADSLEILVENVAKNGEALAAIAKTMRSRLGPSSKLIEVQYAIDNAGDF